MLDIPLANNEGRSCLLIFRDSNSNDVTVLFHVFCLLGSIGALTYENVSIDPVCSIFAFEHLKKHLLIWDMHQFMMTST
jgi:hypothetical protein